MNLHLRPAEKMEPGTTCRSSTAVSASLSASSELSVSAGTLAKASLVGAKMVKASAFLTVSNTPASVKACGWGWWLVAGG